MDTDECTICLEAINHASVLGTVEGCNHVYHGPCISSWAKHSNTCPTCRRKFHRLQFSEKGSKRSLGLERVQDRLLENPAIDDIPREFIIPRDQPHNNAAADGFEPLGPIESGFSGYSQPRMCSICNLAGDSPYVTSCSVCYETFHMGCLGLGLIGGTLVCPICDVEQIFVNETIIRSANRSRPRARAQPVSRRGGHVGASSNAVFSHRIVSLLNPAIGVTTVDDDDDALRPLLRRPRSRPGLVIHNENNEIDDDFLYEQDIAPTASGSGSGSSSDHASSPGSSSSPRENLYPQSSRPVLNGGVLLRKELRMQELLTEDEAKSWELFDEAKRNERVVGTLVVSGSDNSSGSSCPRKKRRRRVSSHLVMPSLSGESTGTSPGETRISSLINQIKHSTNNRPPVYLDHNNSASGSTIHSRNMGGERASDEERAKSPLSSTSSRQHLPVQLPSSVGGLDSPLAQLDLTLEQKQMVQKHIRNNLRTIYKPNGDPTEYQYPILKSETEYIEVNKTASRRIYRYIVEEYEQDNQFQLLFEEDDETKLKSIVDEFVNRELRAR